MIDQEKVFYIGISIWVLCSLIVTAIYIQSTAIIYKDPSRFDSTNKIDIKSTENETIITLKGNYSEVSLSCTGSMLPAINCLDSAIVEHVTNDTKIRIGDIISYKINKSNKFSSYYYELLNNINTLNTSDYYIMHTIVDYNNNDDCYILRGYNNFLIDKYCVKKEDITDKLISIIYADNGKIMINFNGKEMI